MLPNFRACDQNIGKIGRSLRPFDSTFKTHFLIQKLTVGGFCSSRRLSSIHSFLVKTPLTFSIKGLRGKEEGTRRMFSMKCRDVIGFLPFSHIIMPPAALAARRRRGGGVCTYRTTEYVQCTVQVYCTGD